MSKQINNHSYVTINNNIVTGYDNGSDSGDYYCEMQYDATTGIYTVLSHGSVINSNEKYAVKQSEPTAI